jgi:hypothetical protein
MGRNLKIRYQKHVNNIKNNRYSSKFATHLQIVRHFYEPIDQIMTKICHANKGSLMNIKESLHIYLNIKIGCPVHKQNRDGNRWLFDLVHEPCLSQVFYLIEL